MKRTAKFSIGILILMIGLFSGFKSEAQQPKGTHLYLQGDIGTSDYFVREQAQIGVTNEKNRIVMYAESFVNTVNYRKFFGGIKYSRLIPVISTIVVAAPGLGVDTRLNGFRHGGENAISLRPELALNFNAGWFSFIPRVYAQYMEHERAHYGASAGIGLTF